MPKKPSSEKDREEDAPQARKGVLQKLWKWVNENPMISCSAGFVIFAVLVALFPEKAAFNLMVAGTAVIVLGIFALTAVVSAIDTFELKWLWLVVLCLGLMAGAGTWAYFSFTGIRHKTQLELNAFARKAVDLAVAQDKVALERIATEEAAQSMLRAGGKLSGAEVKYEGPLESSFRFEIPVSSTRKYMMNVSKTPEGYKVTHFAGRVVASKPAKSQPGGTS